MKCLMGTKNCIKESTKHDTCHIDHGDGFGIRKSFKFVTGTDVSTMYEPPEFIPPVAIKHDAGKYDPTMLSVEMVELVSRVRMFGSKKYARGNWKKGFKITRSLAAALRHIFSYLSGEDNDSESGLSHLGHAICCIEHAIYDSVHHKQNDDRRE